MTWVAGAIGLLAVLLGLGPGLDRPAYALEWEPKVQRDLRLLHEGAASDRRQALRRLGRLPLARCKPLILKALDDPDLDMRKLAATLAVRHRVLESLPYFHAWLTHWDPEVRVTGAEALARLGSAESVRPLQRALSDPESSVRLAVVKALGQVADPKAEEIPSLLSRLSDPSSDLREQLVEVLAEKGDRRAVIPLFALLRDPASGVRKATATALGKLGDPRAGPALVEAIRDTRSEVALAAMEALGVLRYQPAVWPLIERLAQPGSSLQDRAALTLAQLGSDLAIDALVQALADATVSASARRALIACGDRAGPRIARLIAASDTQRALAMEALTIAKDGRMASAVPALVEQLRRSSLPTLPIVEALGAIGSPAAERPLVELVQSPHAEVRLAAVVALGACLDERAAHPLLGLIHDPDRRVRLQALGLLGRLKLRSVVPRLLPLLSTSDTEVKAAVILALESIRDPRSVLPLAGLLGHPELRLRTLASQALAAMVAPDAALGLLDRCQALAPMVQPACIQALGGILRGRSHPKVLAHLLALVEGSNDALALAALEALGALRDPELPQALLKLAGGQPPSRLARILEGLGGLGQDPDGSVMSFLGKALSDQSPRVRAAAALGLNQIGAGARKALPTLEQALRDPHWAVQVNASAALARWADTRQVPLLRRLAHSRVAPLRANALLGLGRLRDETSRSLFEDRLEQDRDPWVRLSALRALASLGFKPLVLSDGTAYADLASLRSAMARTEADARLRQALSALSASPIAPSPTPQARSFLALTLLDARQQPLREHPLLLVATDGQVLAAFTDAHGRAVFEGLAPGLCFVEAPVLHELPPLRSARSDR